jgi:hypothetical protein
MNAARRACDSGSSAPVFMSHADAPHPFGLLRARRERPCGYTAAEKRDELPPPHWLIPRPRITDQVNREPSSSGFEQ